MRFLLRLSTSLAAAALCACGGDDPPAGSTHTTTVSTSSAPECAEGFSADARGACVEIVPAEPCPAGTRPAIGSATCVPVGIATACPDGLSADASGWGCTDTLPAGGCAGATREAVGSTSCVAIGDCAGAFPPAGALLVDDDFGPGDLDATHFATIGDALAAAAPGATVAVEAGTYAEDLSLDASVTLVGRCPAQVRIEPVSGVDPGIVTTKKTADVTLRGLTVVGHYTGIAVYAGAHATIEDVVVEAPVAFGILVDASSAVVRRSKVAGAVISADGHGAWGIAAGGPSEVTVEDAMVEGGTDALLVGTEGATLTATRFVATGQAPQPPIRAAGVYARGGSIALDRCVLHDMTVDGAIEAELAPAKVEVKDTVVRDVHLGGALAHGHGAVAFDGAALSIATTTISRADSVGVVARAAGSSVEVVDSVVLGPPSASAVPDAELTFASDGAGMGVQVTDGASAALDGLAVQGAFGFGIFASSGAKLDAKRVLVDAMRALDPDRIPPLPFGLGIEIDGAEATLEDVTVTRALLGAIAVGKAGRLAGSAVYVRDVTASEPIGIGAGISVGEGGVVELDRCAIVESATTGLLATRGPEASIHLTSSTLRSTRPAAEGFGHAVVALGEASVVLERCSILDSFAVGVAAAGGRVRLVSSVVAGNPVALHVQDGSFLVESDADGALDPDEVRVSHDCRFVENATRIGSGEIPLPEDVVP